MIIVHAPTQAYVHTATLLARCRSAERLGRSQDTPSCTIHEAVGNNPIHASLSLPEAGMSCATFSVFTTAERAGVV